MVLGVPILKHFRVLHFRQYKVYRYVYKGDNSDLEEFDSIL